jgi:glycolate oxidase FAD binding subunit
MTAAITAPDFAPSSVEEASALFADLAAHGTAIAFAGGGTKLGFGNPVEAGAVVRSSGLNRVLDYAPEDLVVTVEAGVTLAALQAALAPHKQRLAFDAPEPEKATIGGLVATNDFGQRRVRYGSLRDLIIGVQFLGAGGAITRGGGKVVKNVAGFDLPKLMVGSFGTLGFLTSATFRLHPVPETARMVIVHGLDAAGLRALTKTITRAQLEPAVLLGLREGAASTALVVFEGFAAGVDEQVESLLRECAALGFEATAATPEERKTFHERHQAIRSHGELHVKVTALPSDLETLDRDVIAPLCSALQDARATVYPSLGVAFVGGDIADLDVAIAAVRAVRTAAERGRGSLVLRRAPDEMRALVDAWGSEPASIALMRRLKDRFDPENRLNRGRLFAGRV